MPKKNRKPTRAGDPFEELGSTKKLSGFSKRKRQKMMPPVMIRADLPVLAGEGGDGDLPTLITLASRWKRIHKLLKTLAREIKIFTRD